MSKQRTRQIGFIAIGLIICGAFGMALFYRSALSPCLVPGLEGTAGFENGFPIGQSLTGATIFLDILDLAKSGPVFLAFGLLWVAGSILVRVLMGWGDLEVTGRPVKLLGIFGAVFQLLGSFMFLYSAWIIVATLKLDQEVPISDITASYGMTLRSTLSGLTTFGIGNVMTAIFLKHAIDGKSAIPTKRKRKIVASLSFVPMGIAIIALVNALLQEINPTQINSTLLAASLVGFALPMVVGSIPLMVNSKSIPRS